LRGNVGEGLDPPVRRSRMATKYMTDFGRVKTLPYESYRRWVQGSQGQHICRLGRGREQKSPEVAFATSGTNIHSRYHPDYFPKGKITLGLQQVPARNGGSRVSLLTQGVHKTNSGIRSRESSAPAHTNRRLSEASDSGEFSVIVFDNII